MSATDFNSKPIESEVFRFISVRNPQRITRTQANRITISYPIAASSDLYDDLKAAIEDPANETDAAKLSACKDLAAAYKIGANWVDDAAAINTLVPSFDGLFDWLQLKINGLTIAALTAKVTGLELPTAAVCSQLWDNLFARLVLGGYGSSRTAIMEYLMVNNLLTNYLDDTLVANDEELRVMVNAQVVLPKPIFPLPGSNTPRSVYVPSEPDGSAEARAALIALALKYDTALKDIDAAKEVQIEAIETLQAEENGGLLEDGDPQPTLIPMALTAEIIASFGTDTAALLSENGLSIGATFSFCTKVLGRELAKILSDIQKTGGSNRYVVAVGGALWRANGKVTGEEEPVICDSEGPAGSADMSGYDDFYLEGGMCRIKPLGIGDLLKVEQKLCCYAPGEVAHIENVMQGEYKERSTRRLKRTEQTFISISEKETTDERDSITTEQFEIQKETSTVIQQDQSLDIGLSVAYSYGPVKVNLNTNFATSTSTNTSNSQASFYAQNLTERSLKRVVERVREERITKITDEFEENNKHGLDNRLGTAHVVGLYRWTDKIYEVWIRNYGKRLMFEFLIPEPAAFHLWAMAKPNVTSNISLKEPLDPRSDEVITEFGVPPLSQLSISDSNYYIWGKEYGVTLDPPPAPNVTISMAKSEDGLPAPFARSLGVLAVPDGYAAQFVWSTVLKNNAAGWVTVQIGTWNQRYFAAGNNSAGVYSYQMTQEEGEIPISIVGNSDFYALNVKLVCSVKASTINEWKKNTFDRIMTAYFDQKRAFDQAISEAKSGFGNGLFGTNPAFNRQIEQGELKKGCLNWLTYGGNFSTDGVANYGTDEDCTPPAGITDCCVVTDTERVKFLEQVFDWQNMTYTFYPYFYGQKCRWKKLYQQQDADPQFLSFLQAGMARVLVPVRLHFEREAMHFLRTGQVWNGGPVPAIDSELYLSIIEELYPKYGTEWHSDKWELRVPTTLTVLQCGSGCASGDGLPCDCGTGIGAGTSSVLTPGTSDPVLPGEGH